ncbi:Putative mRNA-capping enzyme P5 [Rhizoctonia solani]|uniref:Putative mRNA-capping enzyme P5 n=1 Tax=Rhizoctonia solani TaxID=456999 RepID=A0A0K6GFR1_9AGAM|nr:Putative mRNA-capping enzyme P5 [Rhizoctonia solani]
MSGWFKSTYNKMRRFRIPNDQPSIESNTFGTNSIDQAGDALRNVYILVVGRFGCGKTDLINMCGAGHFPRHGVNYRLLNTTGFDAPDRTEIDVHTKIAKLLLHHSSHNEHISGIIYCHPSNEMHLGGSTQRSIRVLIELFLGRQEIHRLTILVLPPTITDTKPQEVAGSISYHSTLFNEAVAGGAIIVAGGWSRRYTAKHLRRYCSMTPFCPPICQPTANNSGTVQQLVEKVLGYYGAKTIGFYIRSLQQSTQDKEALEARIAGYQTEAEQRYNHQSNNIKTLGEDEYERLRRSERDYASLRSQVQLQISYEQGAIVQDLRKINDMIERLGDSISEHLVDTYEERALNKGTVGATVSDARDLPGLRTWLRQYTTQMRLLPDQEKHPEKYLSLDNFINFFARCRLCHILNDSMFKPFHPFVEPTENVRLAEYYEKIEKQERQYTAGKWRSITFQMLCTSSQRTMEEQTEAIAQELMGDLSHLGEHLFGLKGIPLEECYYNDLRQIIKQAWEWTSRLKTEVILLGDFYPITCPPGRFDSASAMEFEASSHKISPKLALCTLGFGLVSRQAKGGGELPSETIVLKTSVLTDSYYTPA